jgi:hypothetical protein
VQHREQLQERAALIADSYDDVFNHIAVRRGWRSLAFTRADVRHAFTVAAQVVALARAYIDRAAPSFRIRQVDGTAREELWHVPAPPAVGNPNGSGGSSSERLAWERALVARLVHASMRDARGYVDGVDARFVDAFLHAHPWWVQHDAP